MLDEIANHICVSALVLEGHIGVQVYLFSSCLSLRQHGLEGTLLHILKGGLDGRLNDEIP